MIIMTIEPECEDSVGAGGGKKRDSTVIYLGETRALFRIHCRITKHCTAPLSTLHQPWAQMKTLAFQIACHFSCTNTQ